MSERDLKELIKKRASLKGRLTTFGKYIEELTGTLNRQQVNELQLRIGKIELLFEQYDAVQTKVECLADDVSLQSAEREEFESFYYKSLARAQEILSCNSKSLPNEAPSCESCSHTSQHRLIKLPTINLPKFNGSYNNWLEFHDTFDSLIHSNEAIGEINKFHYLRASLEGSAAVMIQEIQFSASNYTVAWKLLCERYHNKRLLIQTHVNNLFNIDTIKNESSVNLKRLIDQLNKSLRALESLGEPTSYWDTLLIHMMSRKIDYKTLREWEECKGRLNKEKPITLSIFLDFIRNRGDLLETMEVSRSNLSHTQFQQPQPPKGQKITALASVAGAQPSPGGGVSDISSSGTKSCPYCKGEHYLNNCDSFLGLSNEQRWELIPQFKVCYNCFRSGHYSNRCKKGSCTVCKRRHNTLLHTSSSNKRGINQPAPARDAASIAAAVQPPTVSLSDHGLTLATHCADEPKTTRQDVLLSTALVKVVDGNGHDRIIRVLLDCASTSCLITEKLCRSLNVKYVDIDKPIFGINKTQTNTTKMCFVSISSRSESYSKRLICYVLTSITDDVPCRSIDISQLNIPANIILADPQFYKASEIDMIIGSNVFWDLLGSRKINLGANNPILWETRLGWLVSGPVNGTHGSAPLTCNFTKLMDVSQDPDLGVDDTQNLLSRFWQLEEVGLKSSYSEEERKCEEHFVKNTTRLADGRFCVRLPLKQSADCLGDSLQRAKRCLQALERRFEKQPDFRDRYVSFMSEYLTLGHMSECTLSPDSTAYFIPHHGVLNENSTTTKLRVVFNASSPTTSGISLNEVQMVGPTVQDELLSILLRFRLYKYILAADVEKMYRQVAVHPDDRFLQKILWRASAHSPMKMYELNTVTYGCASASYLATRCLKQIGLECSDEKISEIIIHDFYVDDLLTGSNSFSEALDIKKKVTAELSSAKMPLRKWKSNDPRLCLTSDPCDESSSLNLNIGSLDSCKTLGLDWQTATDELYFSVDSCETSPSTKRSMLSVTARIFDPMGLVSPCIIPIKILLQRLWVHKLSWDEELPLEIAKIWANIIKSLPLLNELRIPRLIVCEAYTYVDFHIFTDASEFSREKKHHIILQSTHLLTKLLFKAEHLKLMHAGPQLLLASIREAYWPIGGRNLAKATYHNCTRCTRMRAKIITPLMGNLPEQRLSPGHPFECVGIDYAGPISSANRLGRGCRIVKVYIAIFVCFKTKAIHIELVGDLTSNSFLSALRRFISRRGKPTDIYSDNGTSFVGAYNQISKFLKSNCNSLPDSLAEEGINFHLCPPYSPHFGGLWEAGVKSIKFHMHRVLGNCNLIYEELITVLTQIEAILNSRPLTPLSSDPDDLMPLTPGHFLIGKPLTAMPTPDYRDCQLNHLTRFQRLESMRQHFWTRWSKEYISELQQRTKWRSNQSSLKLNSLVVVKEDNLPPLKWKLGRIVAVYPGADGVNRVADIRTSSGVIKRSFSKICPLIAD